MQYKNRFFFLNIIEFRLYTWLCWLNLFPRKRKLWRNNWRYDIIGNLLHSDQSVCWISVYFRGNYWVHRIDFRWFVLGFVEDYAIVETRHLRLKETFVRIYHELCTHNQYLSVNVCVSHFRRMKFVRPFFSELILYVIA